MFPSKEQRLAKWATTRQKGKRRFVLVNGVLGWGLLTAILWLAFMWAIMPTHFTNINLAIVFTTFPIGGFFWGYWVWYLSERDFKNNTQSLTD